MIAAAILFALLPGAAVHGTVRAEDTRAPLAQATVEIPGLDRRARTDARGEFTLPDVPGGRWEIRVRMPGYQPGGRAVDVPAGGAVSVDFALAAQVVTLQGVQVQGTRATALSTASGPEPLRVTGAAVAQMPALAEPDVLRAVQALPAVQAASDFSSALYVRGGLPDQNLLMLDGAPLFNPYHLGGIFSAFDPATIESADLLPGGFPAAVGDRLSSVVDVRTREGGRDRVRAAGAVGLISSRASVDGPLPGGRGSYLFSARRTYLDAITDAAHAMDVIPQSLPYAFTDAHLKLTHDVGGGRLSASMYLDEEDFTFAPSDPAEVRQGLTANERAGFGWGSRMATLRYWRPVGASATAEVRAGVSGFRGTFGAWQAPFDEQAGRYRTDASEEVLNGATVQRDVFAGVDVAQFVGAHTRRAGVQVDLYRFDARLAHRQEGLADYLPAFARADRPWTAAAYVEDEWSPSDGLSLRGGVRVLHAGGQGTAWLPRLGLRYALSPRLALSLAASRSAQAMRSIRSEESPFAGLVAYDLLAAVPPQGGLSTAEDLVLGAEWSRGGTRVRVDAYAKRMHDLPITPLPADVRQAPLIVPDSVWTARGTARGLEVMASHAWGKAQLSASYALSFAEFEARGRRYTPRFERRHVLDASALLPLGNTGVFSARLAWATGQPYTPVAGTAASDSTASGEGGETRVVLGEYNSARLPGYFRLDVGARRSFARRWAGQDVTFTPYLSVLNVLNTRNVLFAIPREYGTAELESLPQLPIFPTLGIEWTF